MHLIMSINRFPVGLRPPSSVALTTAISAEPPNLSVRAIFLCHPAPRCSSGCPLCSFCTITTGSWAHGSISSFHSSVSKHIFKKGTFCMCKILLRKKKKAGAASSCGNMDDNLMNTNYSNQQAISGGVCHAVGCGCCISSLGSLLISSWKQNTTLPCPHPSREADLQ